MTNEGKAQEICEKNKRFNVECSSLECYLSALEMAEWKDEQWKEKAQTAFCYVHNCIGQCNTKAHPCELRQKFDDIMNGKWPTVEKTKTK